MADTYTQINIHAVFAVKGRKNLLLPEWRGRLFEYISGTTKHLGGYPLSVNGYSDHVHVFFELPPTSSVSKLMQQIKANSSRWINEQGFCSQKFEWQNGYGAFSYAKSQRSRVINYIQNQERHHQKIRFKKEYLELLEKFEIEFKEKYLFEFYE